MTQPKKKVEDLAEKIFKNQPNLSSSEIKDEIKKQISFEFSDKYLQKLVKIKLKGRLGKSKVNSESTPDKDNFKQWDEQEDTALFAYKGDANIKNLNDAIKFSKVDLDVWEIERHTFNTWTTTLKDNKNKPVQKWNVQVKVWFKKKTTTITQKFKDLQDDFILELKKIRPVAPYRFQKFKEEIALELDIFDPHFGKLAWREETGEDYDLKITEDRYDKAIADLLSKVKGFNISRIIYPIGNDYFHYDNLNGTTTSGTSQNIDGRWQKMWRVGRHVALRTIKKLSLIAPVDVIIVPSNHDFETIYKFGDLLECYFEKDKNINVDNKPTSRKYYKWGKCGLGYTHGNEEKHTDLPLLMMREMQKHWSNVEFMEWHCGHFHKSKKMNFVEMDEYKGIVVRFLKSLSGTDAWHAKRGYTKGIKGAECFLWHKDQGLIGNFSTNIL
jgi:hypothetical protein